MDDQRARSVPPKTVPNDVSLGTVLELLLVLFVFCTALLAVGFAAAKLRRPQLGAQRHRLGAAERAGCATALLLRVAAAQYAIRGYQPLENLAAIPCETGGSPRFAPVATTAPRTIFRASRLFGQLQRGLVASTRAAQEALHGAGAFSLVAARRDNYEHNLKSICTDNT